MVHLYASFVSRLSQHLMINCYVLLVVGIEFEVQIVDSAVCTNIHSCGFQM